MMGTTNTQQQMFHAVRITDLVPEEHPLRKIRSLIDTERIRKLCKPFYCENNGRPSVPPEPCREACPAPSSPFSHRKKPGKPRVN